MIKNTIGIAMVAVMAYGLFNACMFENAVEESEPTAIELNVNVYHYGSIKEY